MCRNRGKLLTLYRKWKDINHQKIEDMINELSFDDNSDVNQLTNDLSYKVSKIMLKEIPLKKKWIKVGIKDNWISSEVLTLMRKRDVTKLRLISGIEKRLPLEIIEKLFDSLQDCESMNSILEIY